MSKEGRHIGICGRQRPPSGKHQTEAKELVSQMEDEREGPGGSQAAGSMPYGEPAMD